MSSNELSNSFLTTSPGNVIEQLPLRHRWAMSSNSILIAYGYSPVECGLDEACAALGRRAVEAGCLQRQNSSCA